MMLCGNDMCWLIRFLMGIRNDLPGRPARQGRQYGVEVFLAQLLHQAQPYGHAATKPPMRVQGKTAALKTTASTSKKVLTQRPWAW